MEMGRKGERIKGKLRERDDARKLNGTAEFS
jgi:hypothetical protein